MFSKALFKQSCKANGTMWAIITFATCFMLASVMLISGNGNIGEVKNSIQDTIITQEIDSQMQQRALFYYDTADDGLCKFDLLFSENASDTLAYPVWLAKMPKQEDFSDLSAYQVALNLWQTEKPEMKTSVGENYASDISKWQTEKPERGNFDSDGAYRVAMKNWQSLSPATQEIAVTTAYVGTIDGLQSYIKENAKKEGYQEDSSQTLEMLGSVLYAINPNGTFNDFYTELSENIPSDYDITSLITNISTENIYEYIYSLERSEYRENRAYSCSSIFIAGNLVKPDNVTALIEALSSYGVSAEKYEGFGYTYDYVKRLSVNGIVTYRGRLEYELELLEEKFADGEFLSEEEYKNAVALKRKELKSEVSSSFLSTLPSAVSEALEEIGQMDLYTLVVGSIFYKLAGLLLPIIYMIMSANNLISGQVDSGSMAYVLSTSTKRSTVVFTQALYLIGSLFLTFSLTTATGCVCLAIVSEKVSLTYGNLILLNVGAFLVLFALSGLCFCTSCLFDRSKRSMAIGGGLSIFALVAAMLGLFGSPVIPSVVRLNALNYFNYATIISLFDVISIMEGSNAFIGKFLILTALGIIGYVIGSLKFIEKDLPL